MAQVLWKREIEKLSFKKAFFWSVLAFLLPAAVLLGLYACMGMAPFGEKSVLITDMSEQYVDFFAGLRDAVLGGNGLLYSWNLDFGGNFFGLFAYYLSSPFSLITLLFPKSQMPLAILILTLLKVGLCGTTFSVFLQVRYRRQDVSVLIFPLFYALMSYNLVYSMSIMWLDGVIWTPILILGVERILQKNRCGLFVAILTLMLFSNYYIAYMAGAFSVVYFLYRFSQVHPGWKGFWKSFGRFLGSAAVSAGLSAVLLIPAFLSVFQGKMQSSNYVPRGFFDLNPLELIPKLFPGNYDPVTYDGLPSIFCGTAVLILTGAFFLSRAFSRKEKLLAGGVLVLFFLSFWIKGLNMIWHLFQYPNWFPYRYGFLCSFFLILLAYQSFLKLSQERAVCLWISGGGLLLLGTLTKLLLAPKLFSWTSYFFFVPCLLAILGGLFCLRCGGKLRVLGLCLVAAGSFTELCWNGWSMLRGLDQSFHYKTEASYREFIEKGEKALAALPKDNALFYRTEKTFSRSKNDAVSLNYCGISHYSSSYNAQINAVHKKLGLAQYYLWGSYYGSTLVTDSLFGIRYLLSDHPLQQGVFLGQTNSIWMYENPTALPLGYLADEKALSFQLDGEALENQNNLLKVLAGKNWGVLTPITDWEEEEENLSVEYKKPGENKTGIDAKVSTRYQKIDPEKPGILRYEFTAAWDGPVYCCIRSPGRNPTRVLVNGQEAAGLFNDNANGSFFVGDFQAGETVTVELVLLTNQLEISDLAFCRLDQAAWQEVYQQLNASPWELDMCEGTRISGTIHADQDGAMVTTIPSDPGWTVWVDGKKVSPRSYLDAFLAVPLERGKHQISMRYLPPGLPAGLGISVLTLLGGGIYLAVDRRRKNRDALIS